MLEIIAWNTLGAKWDSLLQHQIIPRIRARGTSAHDDHLLAVTTECGWPFWEPNRDLHIGVPTFLNGSYHWQESAPAAIRPFAEEVVDHNRNVSIACVPWVRNPREVESGARKSNARCSNGVVWVPSRRTKTPLGVNLDVIRNPYNRADFSRYFRPFIRLQMTDASSYPELIILASHLVSGAPALAVEHLAYFFRGMQALIPEGRPGLIVGDLNINLLDSTDLNRLVSALPDRWRIIRTGLPTHESGSELDFGLLYDPTNIYRAQAIRADLYKTANNRSDHAVVLYQASRLV